MQSGGRRLAFPPMPRGRAGTGTGTHPPSGRIAGRAAAGSGCLLRAPHADQLVQRLADVDPLGWTSPQASPSTRRTRCAPAFNQGFPGFSFGCHVVWMIRHCRPLHFYQPLRKQLHVGNQSGGSDESVEHREFITAPTAPGSAMSDGLTGGQLTMSGIGRVPAAGTGRARFERGCDCAGCR